MKQVMFLSHLVATEKIESHSLFSCQQNGHQTTLELENFPFPILFSGESLFLGVLDMYVLDLFPHQLNTTSLLNFKQSSSGYSPLGPHGIHFAGVPASTAAPTTTSSTPAQTSSLGVASTSGSVCLVLVAIFFSPTFFQYLKHLSLFMLIVTKSFSSSAIGFLFNSIIEVY